MRLRIPHAGRLLLLGAIAAGVLNLPSIKIMLGLEPLVVRYRYVSSDRGFEAFEAPRSGTRLDDVRNAFDTYRMRAGRPRLELYRTFARRPGELWNWLDYLTHPRWRIPFRAG